MITSDAIAPCVCRLCSPDSIAGTCTFEKSGMKTVAEPNLVDEFQLCVHPVIAGKGLPLFENVNEGIHHKLLKTKTFGSGAVTLYYKPISE